MRFADRNPNKAAAAFWGGPPRENDYRKRFLELARDAEALERKFALLMADKGACEIFNDAAKVCDAGDLSSTLLDVLGDFNRAADAEGPEPAYMPLVDAKDI